MGDVIQINNLSRAIDADKELLTLAFTQVLHTGNLVLGDQVKNFESELAEYTKAKHVIGVASGTDALEIAMKVSMPSNKHTVLTAANAGGYSSIAARRAGYEVIYADVDLNTACLTWDHILLSLTEDVGIIVVTHLYGLLTDISTIVTNCRQLGIILIEDCAQALGAEYLGRSAGSFGDISTTSFYPTKNLGALGDGGAIITSNSTLAEKARLIRQYGWQTKYEIRLSGGVNSRLDELQAAFLRIRLPKLNLLNQKRRLILSDYYNASESSSLNYFQAIGSNHTGHLAVFLTENRKKVRSHFQKHGIATDIHFPIPDYRQEGFLSTQARLPNTEWLSSRIITLPCYPELNQDEIARICDVIRKCD